ncbi:MAG: nuclear transport factor 2 family protein [Deltaproteobacteria bacterium]|nr:nuclear transport factor 2 family protein [Deltaproteobacteria bacterium]
MSDSRADENREVVARYFELMQAGAPEIEALFSEDACWLAPQSSPLGRRHAGKAAVLELMASGVGLYDQTQPMETRLETMAAQGDHVFVELTLAATTRSGEPYENHYVFVFRIENGLIREVHEHLDTLYTQRRLFDPVGQVSPLEPAGSDASREGA